MSEPAPAHPSAAATVRLLLAYARRRARARNLRQKQLFNQRSRGQGISFGFLTFPLLVLFGFVVHGLFAWVLFRGVSAGMEVDLQAQGILIVEPQVIRVLQAADAAQGDAARRAAQREVAKAFADESLHHLMKKRSFVEYEQQLHTHYQKYGAKGFLTERAAHRWPAMFSRFRLPTASFFGLAVLLWWFVMVAFQGEGLELDVQRRRHPMWEWLLSHPVQPGAVFFAEMLAPLASNPNVVTAPIFCMGLLKVAGYPLLPSLGAGLLVGVPLAVAASCLNKALEIGAMLRLSPRNRGAFLGLLSWLGFVAFFGALLSTGLQDPMVHKAAAAVAPLARHLGPSLFPALVGYSHGTPRLMLVIALGWGMGLAITGVSVWIGAWATEKGLAGGFGGAEPAPMMASRAPGPAASSSQMLFRKELLWFRRDRGAVVQAILIPGTLAATQLVNLRGLLQAAVGQWHWLCSVAVIFGTYFLFILGPRSLLSEGPALWLALTWPQGMEGLLRAKARFWWLLVQLPVGLGLALAIVLHPADWWKVLLVTVGWIAFSRSLADKTVTLVQAPSPSGEPEPTPAGRRYAVMLGTFTFAAGLASQQWYLALTGVVFSWVTAAAMWQNFRARLPYLYDPWSETLPPPPTVMHAMVAIMAMTEIMAVVSAIAVAIAGVDRLWLVRLVSYGTVGLLTWLISSWWLGNREVSQRDVWEWRETGQPAEGRFPTLALGAGAISGVALGVLAWGYVAALQALSPGLAADFQKAAAWLTEHPGERIWLMGLTVICAPLAEEYLFRGLLYRALDREWGGWRAVAVSAAFFAIYHPPASWLPVGALGALNGVLFRRSRSLWPAVAAHACYNAVVMLR